MNQQMPPKKRKPVGYYRNAKMYVGHILSRMVKGRQIIRIKPGVFRLNEKYTGNSLKDRHLAENQIKLF